jgi:exocyst complex component 3
MNASTTISAAQAVGEYLQSPDDLLKIATFRKKLEKEKASIDSRLKTGVKDQLEATRLGLRRLFSTRNNVQAIKEEMATIDKESSDPAYVVSTFDQIGRVCLSCLMYCISAFIVIRRSQWFIAILSKQKRWY